MATALPSLTRQPDPAGAVLTQLGTLVAKGVPAARCRLAVEDHVARWRRELGEDEAAALATELRDALAEGVEAAEQGAHDYDGEDATMRVLLAAQLAGMVAARDAAAAAGG